MAMEPPEQVTRAPSASLDGPSPTGARTPAHVQGDAGGRAAQGGAGRRAADAGPGDASFGAGAGSAFRTPTRPAARASEKLTPVLARRSLDLVSGAEHPVVPRGAKNTPCTTATRAVFGTLPPMPGVEGSDLAKPKVQSLAHISPAPGTSEVAALPSPAASLGDDRSMATASESEAPRPFTPPALIKRRLDVRVSVAVAPPAAKRVRHIAVPPQVNRHPIAVLQRDSKPNDVVAKNIQSILATASAEDKRFFEELLVHSSVGPKSSSS